MNITRTRVVTRLRTWTLVAGLTGLVIGLGALLGGAFMWLFAGIAVGANLLGSGEPLADALEDIAHDRTPLAVSPVSAPMDIVNPLAGASLSNLFSTHPPVQERIRRLRAYDQTQSSLGVLRPDGAGRWAA